MASLFPSPTTTYRGRLAPSPTGYLHVGHARTFFAAYQRARDAGGALVLRMEDLDPERSRAEYADAALEDLRWLGIRWHEGPDKAGPFAPYEQSRRASVYLAAWQRLRDAGVIYPCRCSRKDLAAALSAPHEGSTAKSQPTDPDPLDDEPIYPGTCRAAADIPAGPEGLNWRFRVSDGEVIDFHDFNLGSQRFVAGVDFGDFLIWRREASPPSPSSAGALRLRPSSAGVPSYQLACVADDAAMGITEVVRGADLLKSTTRQILLNRALGHPDPAWFHTRLVVDHNGRRLAKRNDSLSIRSLRQRGLTPLNVLSADLPIEP